MPSTSRRLIVHHEDAGHVGSVSAQAAHEGQENVCLLGESSPVEPPGGLGLGSSNSARRAELATVWLARAAPGGHHVYSIG